MEEHQVTADGATYPLAAPFFVIATQNPVYQIGTYPLPESQLDRFLMRIELGYPDPALERQLLLGQDRRDLLATLPSTLSPQQLLLMQTMVPKVHVSEALLDYVQAIVRYTRESPLFEAGISPRASIGLLRAAQAWALIHGHPGVMPEDVQAVLAGVVGHRLKPRDESAPKTPNEIGQFVLKEVAGSLVADAQSGRATMNFAINIDFGIARRLRQLSRRWARKRHGVDPDPLTLPTRRIYIIPTGMGIAFALMLTAMFIGAMNYGNNLALGLTFLLGSLALTAMHYCHRNLAGIVIRSASTEPVFAGDEATFRIALENTAPLARHELLRCERSRHHAAAARARERTSGVRSAATRASTRHADAGSFRDRHPTSLQFVSRLVARAYEYDVRGLSKARPSRLVAAARRNRHRWSSGFDARR